MLSDNCGLQDAAAINTFGANLTKLIEGSLLSQKQHAVFLDSCHHHCALWDMICIDDEIVHDAFCECKSNLPWHLKLF